MPKVQKVLHVIELKDEIYGIGKVYAGSEARIIKNQGISKIVSPTK